MYFFIYFWFFLTLIIHRGQAINTERGATTVCHAVDPLLTTSNGAPVDDLLTSQSAGIVGPLLLQDTTLLEELAHFVREKIPERVIYSKGTGAFGTFTVTNTSFAQFCKASLFESLGKTTSMVIRFSNERESGSCETLRGLRGSAIKFYTDDGNFDIVGGNSPIFFIRDPMLYPSLVHALSRNPITNLHDPDLFWDFMTLRPESVHQLLFMFSDRGLPDGYRQMNIYGTNTFKIVNKEGTAFYCKFHFKSNQGVKNLDPHVGQQLCGTNPDYATKDLYQSIENKNYPSWTMYYQVMTFQQAVEFEFNPFDVTKIWPNAYFPAREIGKFILERNPENYFNEVEQVAFSPSNLVPGIEPSPDKIFQGRLFAYPDAQRYRLGVNYQKLPINAPRVPVINTQRDGSMYFSSRKKLHPIYYPSSAQGAAKVCPAAANSKWTITGDVARHNSDNQNNYAQPKAFYTNTMNDVQRERLVINIVDSLKRTTHHIQEKVFAVLKNVHIDLAHRVAAMTALAHS